MQNGLHLLYIAFNIYFKGNPTPFFSENESFLRFKMETGFYENAVYELIYVKRKEPKKENGVIKTIFPLAVVGQAKDLQNKSLNSLYDCTLEIALPKIICALTVDYSEVMFISESLIKDMSCNEENCEHQSKKIEITYIGNQDLLNEFEKSFSV